MTGDTSNIMLVLASNPGHSVLGGTTTVAAVGGIATFSDLSLDKAASGFGRLPEPEDTRWEPVREKVRRMLARADVARAGARRVRESYVE